MKIQINNETVREISGFEKRILSSNYTESDLKEHVENILRWNIESLCVANKENLIKTWLPLLFKRYSSIPTDDESLINLIISQSDYKSKEKRDFELKAQSTSSFKEE